MKDPYIDEQTGILKNLAGIQDAEKLSQMEAEYCSLRLAELVMKKSVSRFDFQHLCSMHYDIFQDIYEWAGKVRIINIESGLFKDNPQYMRSALVASSAVFSDLGDRRYHKNGGILEQERIQRTYNG